MGNVQWEVKEFSPVQKEQLHRAWEQILDEIEAMEGGAYREEKGVTNLSPNPKNKRPGNC